jgi:tRNA(Arg) A34 adenosine deaminase TadA
LASVHAAKDLSIVLHVPTWIDDFVSRFDGPLETDEQRMGLAVALSRENVDRGGGPFAAAVFLDRQLVAAGVNLVLDSELTIAHAEIVALLRAQIALRGAPPLAAAQTLVTSSEPCCQCFGAIVWSAAQRLVVGATKADVEAIGFDEGPKPASWVAALEQRGMAVVEGVCREEAQAVLDEYARRGGTIYGRKATTRSRT